MTRQNKRDRHAEDKELRGFRPTYTLAEVEGKVHRVCERDHRHGTTFVCSKYTPMPVETFEGLFSGIKCRACRYMTFVDPDNGPLRFGENRRRVRERQQAEFESLRAAAVVRGKGLRAKIDNRPRGRADIVVALAKGGK